MSALYDEEEEKKYLFVKKVTCANCEWKFDDLRVMNSKLRRKEPDQDLRPRFQFLDTLKYGVTACPQCGYAAPVKSFDDLNKLQKKLLMEKVTSKFIGREPFVGATVNYDEAIQQHQLALFCAMAMENKLSEQAYLCLQISWLLRGKLEEAEAEPGLIPDSEIQQLKEKEERFYRQAYDGLAKAALEEDFPICGMDQSTYDYMLAVMSFHFKEYDLSTKYCGNVVQNRGISAKLKDKALMLKDEIVAAKKAEEGEAE